MKKTIKKIRKIMAEIGKLEAKEEGLREDLDNAVDDLEEELENNE